MGLADVVPEDVLLAMRAEWERGGVPVGYLADRYVVDEGLIREEVESGRWVRDVGAVEAVRLGGGEVLVADGEREYVREVAEVRKGVGRGMADVGAAVVLSHRRMAKQLRQTMVRAMALVDSRVKDMGNGVVDESRLAMLTQSLQRLSGVMVQVVAMEREAYEVGAGKGGYGETYEEALMRVLSKGGGR